MPEAGLPGLGSVVLRGVFFSKTRYSFLVGTIS